MGNVRALQFACHYTFVTFAYSQSTMGKGQESFLSKSFAEISRESQETFEALCRILNIVSVELCHGYRLRRWIVDRFLGQSKSGQTTVYDSSHNLPSTVDLKANMLDPCPTRPIHLSFQYHSAIFDICQFHQVEEPLSRPVAQK